MERNEKDHITQNMVRLVDCTKNEPELFLQLTSRRFISSSTLQRIKAENLDRVSLYYQLYTECLLTPNYKGLIKCLEESGNESAANILKEISQSASVTSSRGGASYPPSGNAPKNDADFTVTKADINFISQVLNEEADQEMWEDVKNKLLSRSMKNDVGKKGNMKLDITASLETWMSRTKKEERLFSNILKACEDYPAVVEKLEEAALSRS